MARIRVNPSELTDRVIVEYSPEEVLAKDVFILGKEGKAAPTGDKIGNAIQTVAWRDLCINAPQVKERTFKYGNIQVVEGNFVITFFEDMPKVTEPPGGKK